MKKSMLKIVSLLLCSVLFTALLASCGGNESGDKDVTTTQPGTVEQEAESTTEERLKDEVPDANYEGYEFRFLTRYINNPDWTAYDPVDIYAEEENGDTINDAVYKRNRGIEERFNIVIKQELFETSNMGLFTNKIKNSVLADSNDFDAVCPHPVQNVSAVASGYYVNMHDIPHIDFTKPWWDERAVKELTINGKLFYAFGDLMIMHKMGTAAIIFNKDVFQQQGYEYPYALVEEGKWTMDRMLEYMKGFGKDLNSDEKMDMDDQYGYVCFVDSMSSHYNGGGGKFAYNDSTNVTIGFGSEKTYSITEKIFELMYDQTNVINGHVYENKLPIYDTTNNMFMEGRAMFMWIKINVVRMLRSLDGDFGIIPIPKYEESQDRYYSTVNNHVSSYVCVPKTAPDLSRTGAILESMAAESKYTLQPAFYDVSLNTKFVRDTESSKMLDIIFDSTTYDLGLFYDFGGFSTAYYELSRKNNTNIASTFEKLQPLIEKDIGKFMEQLAELDK